MEKDTPKGTLLPNRIAPRQRCTMLSSNSMLMARFTTGKGPIVHGRLLNERDSNTLAKELLQENLCCFTRLTSDEEKDDELWRTSSPLEESGFYMSLSFKLCFIMHLVK